MVTTKHTGFAKYPLQHVALGLLMPAPKHGYGLYQDFEQYFGSIWKAGQTKFYVLLTRLEEEGYLTSSEEEQQGRPNRKVYALTDAGQDVFMGWVTSPVRSLRAVRVEFIARLRFYDLLDLPDPDALIDAQVAVIETMIAEWEGAEPDEDRFYTIVEGFRLQQARFMIVWLEDTKSYFNPR